MAGGLPGGLGPNQATEFVARGTGFADAIDEIIVAPFDDPYWEVEIAEVLNDVACYDWYAQEPVRNDAQNQINNTFVGYNYDEPAEYDALYPDYWAQPPPADVQSDQVVVIDSDEQIVEEQDEDVGFFDAPVDIPDQPPAFGDADPEYFDDDVGFFDSPLDAVIVDPPAIYDSSEQLEDTDELYGIDDAPLPDDVVNQLCYNPLTFDYSSEDIEGFSDAPFEIADQAPAFDQPEQEELDEPFGFSDSLLDVVIATELIPVWDSAEQLEDVDEPYGFDTPPLSEDASNQLYYNPLGFDYDVEEVEGFADGPKEDLVVQSNQVFVSDSYEQLEDHDDPERFWVEPTPDNVTGVGQLFFNPLGYDYNDPDEPDNFSDAPLSANIAPPPNQLFFNPLAFDYDAEDQPKDLGFSENGPIDDANVESNQIFIEDGANQLEDFDDPLDWATAPLPDDIITEERENDESADEQEVLDDIEDFGFDIPPLPVDVHNQIIVVMPGNNYDDPDHYDGFFDAPLAVDPIIESNQVFITDSYEQLEDHDDPENFTIPPLAADAIVQSDQVFVEDGAWIQEDEAEPQDFSDVPVPDNVFTSNQIFFVTSAYDYEDKEVYEGFSEAPLSIDLVIESDQVFVEDGSNFDVEADVELFSFFDAPGVPELVVESDQVFITDSYEQLETHDDPENFNDLPTVEDIIAHRSRRSHWLHKILDAKVVLKSTTTRSVVNSVAVEVYNKWVGVPVEELKSRDRFVTVWPIATKATLGRCKVVVDADIRVRSIRTSATVNDIVWVFKYSRARPNSIYTKTRMRSSTVSSSNAIKASSIMSVTRYNRVTVSGTKHPSPLEIVRAIAAVRKLRGKS